jgi:hypothetical protein
VQEQHGVRDVVIKDRQSNRDDRKIGPGTLLQEEPQKDGHVGRGVGHNRNATMAKGTEAQSGSYV